ncbi:MAG TPA: lipopolysaccharide heptosyltransferase II [Candidatus Limnocylindria bacterium]|nr:lipopolysaccharide heptosyltransferase II [Candidatus Limnocylindria bacterium]
MSTPASPLSATPPRRLLVRGVNWLGDAVMTTPALLRLRERFPAAEITLLTHEKLAGLWPGHPAIDRVLAFGAKEGAFAIARRLRAGSFDLALLLPNSPRSGFEAWLARIPRRVGGAWPWRDGLLTEVVPPAPGAVKMRKRTVAEVKGLVAGKRQDPTLKAPIPPSSHQLFHYLRLVARLGGNPEPLPPRLAVSAGEVEAAREKFGLVAGPVWVGLNAGAEYGPAKRWPTENFVVSAQELHRRLGCRFILFGGRADLATAESIATELAARGVPRSSVPVLAGQTSLRELCATLAACQVLLTNDTGPMHVAAALGVPVVVPFGSTSPELTGPGLPGDPRHRLLRSGAECAPCFRRECPVDFRCMKGIATGRVVTAVLQTLERGGSPR